MLTAQIGILFILVFASYIDQSKETVINALFVQALCIAIMEIADQVRKR